VSSNNPSLAAKSQASSDRDQDNVARKKWEGQNKDEGDKFVHHAYWEKGGCCKEKKSKTKFRHEDYDISLVGHWRFPLNA
jgi:hypothetical protein